MRYDRSSRPSAAGIPLTDFVTISGLVCVAKCYILGTSIDVGNAGSCGTGGMRECMGDK